MRNREENLVLRSLIAAVESNNESLRAHGGTLDHILTRLDSIDGHVATLIDTVAEHIAHHRDGES